jgi:hypothetical protein
MKTGNLVFLFARTKMPQNSFAQENGLRVCRCLGSRTTHNHGSLQAALDEARLTGTPSSTQTSSDQLRAMTDPQRLLMDHDDGGCQ